MRLQRRAAATRRRASRCTGRRDVAVATPPERFFAPFAVLSDFLVPRRELPALFLVRSNASMIVLLRFPSFCVNDNVPKLAVNCNTRVSSVCTCGTSVGGVELTLTGENCTSCASCGRTEGVIGHHRAGDGDRSVDESCMSSQPIIFGGEGRGGGRGESCQQQLRGGEGRGGGWGVYLANKKKRGFFCYLVEVEGDKSREN